MRLETIAIHSGFQDDPGPGGLAGVMTYGLLNPPGLVSGDVLLQDGVNGPVLDVIRFNPAEICSGSTGCLVFYSDNLDGFDALGDTASPPGAPRSWPRATEPSRPAPGSCAA